MIIALHQTKANSSQNYKIYQEALFNQDSINSSAPSTPTKLKRLKTRPHVKSHLIKVPLSTNPKKLKTNPQDSLQPKMIHNLFYHTLPPMHITSAPTNRYPTLTQVPKLSKLPQYHYHLSQKNTNHLFV